MTLHDQVLELAQASPQPPTPPTPPTAPTAPTAPQSPTRAPSADQSISIGNGPDGIRFKDGNIRNISIKDGKIVIEKVDGTSRTVALREVVPPGAVDIVQSIGFTLIMLIVGFPISRAIARWIDRRSTGPRVPKHVIDKLQHMEQSLDDVALQVERISEAQRFSAQLLARQNSESVPVRERIS